ncbi:LacI family DNA-binding transcriptional regulator, partial [Asanoa sp. NPDC050611]|uniref:LacI family DNA-binding transcriptional regulator n=1 Tax=Asanoa sp. NPDC050611 TaxID=3157098 RepID=UPI003402A300
MKALSKSKAATIYEVARHAGVSIATVSRALRDSDLASSVSASSRARMVSISRRCLISAS